MRTAVRKVVVPFAATSMALFGLAACGGDDDGDTEETTSQETTTEEPSPDETEAGPVEGDAAPWATPVTTPGELIGTIEAGDVTVEVYEVAVDQSTRTSTWADPDTEEPFVDEGDDVVVLNYVVTNNGDPINLGYGLVDVGLRYDDWPFLQQPSVSDNTLLEQHDVNSNGVDEIGEDVYVLGTGEQYSVGEVMLHQPGEAYTIRVEVAPRDDAGDRLDETFEGELTGTIE